jgi:phosphatidylinositol alpha-1,6-mannosyltransferase
MTSVPEPQSRLHLMLTYDFPPMDGGIARMMGEIARRYPPSSLVVSTGAQPDSTATDATIGHPVRRTAVPSRRLRTVQGLVSWTRAAESLARATRPEFVWCGNFKPAGYPARWINGVLGTPYGLVLYGTELLLLQHRLARFGLKRGVARSLLGAAAAIVAISRWTRDLCVEVLTQLGLEEVGPIVRVVPLGTDPGAFRPGLPTGAVRLRYGLGQGRWLLTVARLAAHKGIDTGLRVLAALRAEFPDLRYAIVGSGVERTHLGALAKELGVEDRVRFLGHVPEADLPALYNCAEIYLGLSRTVALMAEGFGIALTEASACGLPVVGGLGGGIPDAVRDGETGFLVDSSLPGPATEAVSVLLGNRDLGRRLGDNGRRAAEQHYNWDRVAADFYRIGSEFAPG